MAESSSRGSEHRKRLGRGLAALLGDARLEGPSPSNLQGAKQVPIEFVRTSARNPRQVFSEPELEELAASIKERGIIQPIIVRAVVDAADAYEIVAGERRWRAAQRAGLHTVPIVVLQINDREALEFSIIENVQRSDLNALEEARGYAQLASEYGYSQADIGRIVGKSRSHVANTLRLLALPKHTRELLSTGALTAGHARALLPLSDPDTIADRIIAQGLTVRDVEDLNAVETPVGTTKAKRRERDPNITELESRLSLALGAKVKILHNARLHKISIKLADLEQFEFVCGRLLGSETPNSGESQS